MFIGLGIPITQYTGGGIPLWAWFVNDHAWTTDNNYVTSSPEA